MLLHSLFCLTNISQDTNEICFLMKVFYFPQLAFYLYSYCFPSQWMKCKIFFTERRELFFKFRANEIEFLNHLNKLISCIFNQP